MLCIGILRGTKIGCPGVPSSLGVIPALCTDATVETCILYTADLSLMAPYPYWLLSLWLPLHMGGGGLGENLFYLSYSSTHSTGSDAARFPRFAFSLISVTLDMSVLIHRLADAALMSSVLIHLSFTDFYRVSKCWSEILLCDTVLFFVTVVKSDIPYSPALSKSIFICYHTRPRWIYMWNSEFLESTLCNSPGIHLTLSPGPLAKTCIARVELS